ncbi:MAG TPA: hypothetical protein VLA23_07275 [Candidatus Limnocylindrales bacterium]|nr:hypothetical protein [Candidatus Limnocylindrales bacterium]
MGKRDEARRWPPGVDGETAATLDKDARRALRRLAKSDAALVDALAVADRRRQRLAEAMAAGRKGRKRRRRLGAAEADVRAAAEEVLEEARAIGGPASTYVWPSIAMAEGALAQLGESSLMHGREAEDHADLADTLAADAAETIEAAEATEDAAREAEVDAAAPGGDDESVMAVPGGPHAAEPPDRPVQPDQAVPAAAPDDLAGAPWPGSVEPVEPVQPTVSDAGAADGAIVADPVTAPSDAWVAPEPPAEPAPEAPAEPASEAPAVDPSWSAPAAPAPPAAFEPALPFVPGDVLIAPAEGPTPVDRLAAPPPPAPAVEPELPAVAPIASPGGIVLAAIDVGSNSVHLLVASLGDHQLEPLDDESEFLGLGRAADAGALGAELRAALTATLVRYVETARGLGASSIAIVGTEPLRRSGDAAVVVAEVGQATGVPLHVLGHEEEALLNLLGATEGRPVETDLAVVDIGGGSSELVVVSPGVRATAFGLPVGSARLTDRFLTDDPPTPREIEALRSGVRDRLIQAPVLAISELVAVGGTADNLARIVAAAAEDRILTPRRLEDALAILMAEPAASAAERHAIRPERARILPAGAVILGMLLEHYGLTQVRASGAGMREGLVRALGRAGASWRDQLEPLAHGWVD